MRRPIASLLGLLLLLGASAGATADNRAEVRTTYFIEPAASERVQVLHLQADASVDAGRPLTFQLGYDNDVVSGATPRTYGSSMDAISSATRFSDVRHSFHGGVEYRTGPVALDGGYSYGFENDYRSQAVNASARVDLFHHNTTFALGYAHNFDSVCDVDNQGLPPLERVALSSSAKCFTSAPGLTTQALAIDSYQASYTQVLTPRILMELVAGLEVLNGFQSSPYRTVRLFGGAAVAQESEPTLRQRASITARVRYAIPAIHSAVGALGRFYWDTWGIRSGTAEVNWASHVGDHWLLGVRGRVYQQSRAIFYRDAGEALSYETVGPVGQYFTGDRELSPLRDWLAGLSANYVKSAGPEGRRFGHLFTHIDIGMKLDAIKYEALTPLPPSLARDRGLVSALVAQLNAVLGF